MADVSLTEAAHRRASDAEQVTWVDQDNQVLGQISRVELRERGLIGRGTFVFLFNSKGELCVHQRTFSKALYPGYWDIAAGGMVAAGETDADSAARELAEELGIVGVPLKAHGRLYFDHPDNRLWCAIFSAVSDAPLQLQPEEVLQAQFIALEQLPAWFAGRDLCPDSLAMMRQVPALAEWVVTSRS